MAFGKKEVIGTAVGALVGAAATFGGIMLKNALGNKKETSDTEPTTPDEPAESSEDNSEES